MQRRGGGLLAGVEQAVADKSGDHGVLDGADPARGIALHHPFLGQPVQQVHRGRASIGKTRQRRAAGSQVMEGRHCFGHLSVQENLLTGAYTRRDGNAAIKQDLEMVYDYFPRLRERRTSVAGYTSGGEQQMTAIGRALMSRPKMILLDEPSMGLAPQLQEEIFEIVKSLNEKEGVSFLLAEQNTNIALRYATYGFILESGRIVLDGAASELRENDDVKEFYLGVGGEGRRSFRDVKHYKRRKRWLS